MSSCLDSLQPSFEAPPPPERMVYQKDFQSIEKMVMQFKSAYEHKNIAVSEFNAYHKNMHDVQLLLNSFMLNTFEVMSKHQMQSCLRNWQALVYDQNQKAKQMLVKCHDSEKKLNQKNSSIVDKIQTRCQRCLVDIRRVNIDEIKKYLDNQYMGMLDRIIMEAKMQINGQLFSEQEDHTFFKQLHYILKKKNQQIEFNNKSIESLIDKITKEISDLNIIKTMAIQDSNELEPPSYTWMRNIKTAMNDLLQSTFKKKVPMFIENMVKLFEQHQQERRKSIERHIQIQTDDYEAVQINGLKEKIHKLNGIKFKLENDLKWVEHELQNQKKEMKIETQKLKKQLQKQWNELIEERQSNKRLKIAIQNVTNQTVLMKEELRKKSHYEKRQEKVMTKEIQPQKDKQNQKSQFNQTNTSLMKKQSTLNKSFSKMDQNIVSKPTITEKQATMILPTSQQQKQKINYGQQQSKRKPQKLISKSNLQYRKSISQNGEIQSKNFKKKIEEALVKLDLKKQSETRQHQKKFPISSKNNSNINQKGNYQNQKVREIAQQDDQNDENYQDTENDQISNSEAKISIQKQAQQDSKLSTGKSIILPEEQNKTVDNFKYNQNGTKRNHVQALQQIQNSLSKSPRSSNFFQNFDLNSNSRPQNFTSNCQRNSEARESTTGVNASRKYNEEVLRVNELMEKRIKRSGIMVQYKFPKKSQEKNQTKIDEKLLQTKKTEADIEENNLIKNHHSSMLQLGKCIDLVKFNKEVEELIKNIAQKIQLSLFNSVQRKGQDQTSFQLKSMMFGFLQKCGLKIPQNLFSIQALTQFQTKANKSVSFQKENDPTIKKKVSQANRFSETPQLLQSITVDEKILPMMYKTSVNTPKHVGVRNAKTSNNDLNLLKRSVWKSLPDQEQSKNEKSLEKPRLTSKIQKPLLKDIKKYGHKKYESCDFEVHQTKKPSAKVDIFTKQDLDLFIDEANSYSYECGHIKRQPKPSTSLLTSDYQILINNLFTNMQEIRQVNINFYNEIASFIRYPYQTVNNLIWGACMIKGIKYESFQKYMERIIHLHRKCPISPETGHCAHLTMFGKKIETIKNQALRLS